MKVCIKCGKEKELECFYAHPQMKDGHLNSCKECVKKASNKNRMDKAEYYKNYDRNRVHLKKRVLARKKYYEDNKNTKKYKESHYLATKKYRKNNKEKYLAESKLNYAVAAGKIKKEPCKICGYENTQAHHEDYSKALDVIWLCNRHHKDEHIKLRRLN